MLENVDSLHDWTVIRENCMKRYCSEKNKIKEYSSDSRNFGLLSWYYVQASVHNCHLLSFLEEIIESVIEQDKYNLSIGDIDNRAFGLSGILFSGFWLIGDIAIGLLVYRGIWLSGFWLIGVLSSG